MICLVRHLVLPKTYKEGDRQTSGPTTGFSHVLVQVACLSLLCAEWLGRVTLQMSNTSIWSHTHSWQNPHNIVLPLVVMRAYATGVNHLAFARTM